MDSYTTFSVYVHSNMAKYVLSNSKPFGVLPKMCLQEHS